MVIYKQLLLTLAFLSCSSTLLAAVEARLDRSVMHQYETLQLTISVDNSASKHAPNIAVIEQNFDIINSSQSSQSSWVNGKASSSIEWTYHISPKASGLLTIPSIRVGNEKTTPISVNVKQTNNDKSKDKALDPVFIEAETDKSSVYVQEQLLLTLKINSAVRLSNLQLEELVVDNALITELNNTSYERKINNTDYATYEVQYAIHPQTSGSLTIPPLKVAGTMPSANNSRSFDIFRSRGKNVRFQSQSINIDVKEIPQQLSNNTWLPAYDVRISDSWSADPENIQVGDSITRTITSTAIGLSAAQLLPIQMDASSAFKVYPDQSETTDKRNTQGIVGQRKDAIAIVATQAGNITLPAISIDWWDIKQGGMRSTTLPAVDISIQGDAASTHVREEEPILIDKNDATTILPAENKQALATQYSNSLPYWQMATIISSLSCLFFIVLYCRERIIPSQKHTSIAAAKQCVTSKGDYIKRLKSACKKHDRQAIRHLLLQWSYLQWPQATIHSLQDVDRLAKNDVLSVQLAALDKALYTNNNDDKTEQLDTMSIYSTVLSISSEHDQPSSQLAPLYPIK